MSKLLTPSVPHLVLISFLLKLTINRFFLEDGIASLGTG